MWSIEESQVPRGVAWLRLGFRPFFIGASFYAVIAVLVWSFLYAADSASVQVAFDPAIWHAHEMLFGYAMAVIAGFLLTAIKNWTGHQTVRGPALFILFVSWLSARGLSFVGDDSATAVMAACDLLFMLLLFVAATLPVLKARQFAQAGILSKLFLMLVSNALFYLGVFGVVEQGVQWGLYSGLYMIIALLLVMARRVVPFFIEKGTNDGVIVRNWRWVDNTSLVLLLLLWVVDVFTEYRVAAAWIGAALFVVHVVRMAGWYSSSLWSKPLLWVLYVAYAFIVLGFLLKAAELWSDLMPTLYLHAFAYGGIGVMTIGMMARVILGHTGRDVRSPPPVLAYVFALLVSGAVVRVILPLLDPELYPAWIATSQLIWVAAFLVFILVYTPMLLKARSDGRDG
jgi:uncharacterized protein involved in response to NO